MGFIVSSTNSTYQLPGTTEYTYDHQDRLPDTWKTISGSTAGTRTLIASNSYNEVGQLLSKKLHQLSSGGYAQTVTYGYNEPGWLRTSSAPLFAMQLKYNDGATPQYNGNIAAQLWGTPGSLGKTYSYTYDPVNRLTAGISNTAANSETAITYDVMGNLKTLTRGTSAPQVYNYTPVGNRLSSVTGGAARSYTYDANGNVLSDGTNGFAYNLLNLPNSVTGVNASTYTYDASARKLARVKGSVSTYYIDGIQYTGSSIDFIQTEAGIVRRNASTGTYSYEYNLTDHLGNVRVSFDINGSAARRIQADDYFPFGKTFNSYVLGAKNNYLYNGKEFQDGLGQYDYGARLYDPVIGRWNVIDPLADQRVSLSPYNFVPNNPINRVDPKGALDDWVGKNNADGTTSWSWDDNITSLEQAKAAGYDDYRAPGSIIDNAKIGGQTGTDGQTSVYLGNNATDVSFTWLNSTVTPFQVGTEWLSGNGPRNRNFTNGDVFTEMLRQHDHVGDARNTIIDNVANGGELSGNSPYKLGGVKGVGLYIKDYSTLLTGGLTGNLAVTYLGSYDLKWTATPNTENGTIFVNFSVYNTSTMQSASRPPILGYLPGWQQTVGSRINAAFQTGWGSKTSQSFNWTETLQMK